MNNNQFRKLLFNKPEGSSNGNSQDDSHGDSGSKQTGSVTLGGKKSSFMPMTPRVVKGGIDVDFARQVRERNAASKPAKKFNSYVPRGVKYAAGYTDRAKAREEGASDAADDKAERIKALEEQMKLGQIEPETFAALRDQITGGDISNTHLVKGLDRQLLERIRRGEDVLGSGDGVTTKSDEPTVDVEDELDKLAEKEVETIQRDKIEKKKGNMAPPPAVAGVKRTRDEILAELKAQRKAAADAKSASLMSGRWKKVGEKEQSRIEIDHKGREVMITVDEDGVVKKKVRKIPAKESGTDEAPIDMPDASKPVLGADVIVPEQEPIPQPTDEDDDDDIFAGVGTEYNPLGDEDDDEDDSDEDSDNDGPAKKSPKLEPISKPATVSAAEAKNETPGTESAPAGQTKPPAAPRNYFKDTSKASEDTGSDRFAGIESVLKKAARLDPLSSAPIGDGEQDQEAEAREARRKKHAQMLSQQDRDLDDMDMGFGSSRYEDEADGDGDGPKMRLSEWKGGADGDDDGWEQDGKGDGKKKRKPKKRKGDVNNAADIMRVIEGRRTAGGK